MADLIKNSIAFSTVKAMEVQGKVKSLSFEETSSIDRELSLKLKEIKNDYELKEKNSVAYVAKMELASFGL